MNLAKDRLATVYYCSNNKSYKNNKYMEYRQLCMTQLSQTEMSEFPWFSIMLNTSNGSNFEARKVDEQWGKNVSYSRGSQV